MGCENLEPQALSAIISVGALSYDAKKARKDHSTETSGPSLKTTEPLDWAGRP